MIDWGLGGALRTLTRLPLAPKDLGKEERILFWFPLIGTLFGLCSVGISFLPLPLPVRSSLIIGFAAYGTRAFHLDGLCDFADGLGGGWTKEKALAIMKDSHIGAFGVIALSVVFLLQYSCLLSLVEIPLTLLLVPAFGRYMQVIAASFSKYAREGEGTAGKLVRSSCKKHSILPSLQLMLLFLLLFYFNIQYASAALVALLASFCMTIVMLRISNKRLGGVTGDVLGAIEVLSETAAMIGFLLPLA